MSQSLTDLLLSGASARVLIDAAEDILGNPVAFIDLNQNEPLLSKGYPQDDIDDKIYRRRNISLDEYQKDTSYVTALSLTGQPHIIAWPNIRRRRMICGSIIGGRHLGGIRLPDMGHPLEELDTELVIETAKVMGMAMVLGGWPSGSGQGDGQSFLWSILNGQANPSFLANRMIYPLFPEGCLFCMLWYRPSFIKKPTIGDPDFLRLIDSRCYTPADDGYAVLTDYHALLQNREAIEEEIRQQNLLVACSDSFTSVNDIFEQFKTAQAVYSYAQAASQTCGLAFYDDYRLFHMLDHIKREPEASRYIHSRIPFLRDYDRDNGTEYLATIRSYLDCNRNIAQTAETLCIHKNTVFYRLSRLKNDFGLDLEDSKTLVCVYCSLKLLEML